jgi:hypothetical protein
VTGPVTPYWNGTEWEYVSTYIVPPAETQMINNGDMYRLVTSSTVSNLADPNCSFTDQGSIVTMQVIECGIPLLSQLTAFSGKLTDQYATLNWKTTREDEPLRFEVQKSTDGIHFSVIAVVGSHNNYTTEENSYFYTDPSPVFNKAYYRIAMKNERHQSVISRTIQLSQNADRLSFVSVINPFDNELSFEISTTLPGRLQAELLDATGRIVMKKEYDLTDGVNRLRLDHTGTIAAGIYYLRVFTGTAVIQKRVVRQNNR